MNDEQRAERWNKIGEVIFGGFAEGSPSTLSAAASALSTCVVRQHAIMDLGLVNRDFNLLAHRWYHTIGSPQLNLVQFVFAQMGMDASGSHRQAEDMFHLGFLAGVASERDLLRDSELADIEDVTVCLNEADGGVRTIEYLQEKGLIPEFTDEEIEQMERMKKALLDLMERGGNFNDNGQA